MCDELTEYDTQQFIQQGGKLNRRNFNKMGIALLMSTLIPNAAFAGAVTETIVDVTTPDGISDCYLVHPTSGQYPGVILWPDIKGRRSVYQAMAKRLAEVGYSVLVINHYYRDAKAPVVGPEANFGDPETMKFLRSMAAKLSADVITKDAKAYINFLDSHASVDKQRKIGTLGYCMGGGDIMRTAAANPDRIGAAASFHGGELEISDRPDSTHLLIPKSKAQVLHAIAENDDKRSPEIKNILRTAYKNAATPAEIEVYENTLHGWCTPDYVGYHEAQAKRAWSRLLYLFEQALV